MSAEPSLDPGFTTPEMETIYSQTGTVGAILEFEASLALALADVGIATHEEAEAVAEACRGGVDDPTSIVAATWEEGTPILRLRDLITTGMPDEGARKWFHHGATSQDAIDTAQMLQARKGLDVLERQLGHVGQRLRELTVEFRDQPQMGRTFLQDATVTTFGFRTATWLAAVAAHVGELRSQRAALTVQLGGSTGNMAAYGDAGPQVIAALAGRLELAAPDISWHGDRSRVLALAHVVERIARSMMNIASDVALLASSSIAEVRLRPGRSSSMPGKTNPIDSIRAIAAGAACTGAVAMLTAAPPHELDRGIGAWHVEWIALPLVFRTASAAVEAMSTSLDSLEVDRDLMSSRVEPTHAAQVARTVAPQIERIIDISEGFLVG